MAERNGAAPQPQTAPELVEKVRTDRVDSRSSAHPGDVQGTGGSVQSEENALEIARGNAALIFIESVHARGYSLRRLAHKFFSIDESILRKWVDGRKPIPLGVLLVAPTELAREIVDRIFAMRAGSTGDTAAAVLAIAKRAEEELASATGEKRDRLIAAMRKSARAYLNATEGP